MLAVLSPAKKLDFNLSAQPLPLTSPPLIRQTSELMRVARELTSADLKRLMKLSDGLARLNRGRFQSFAPGAQPKGSKQAALAFSGDTYVGLAAWDFDAEDFDFAQGHLRILSGLYGLLRPLDAIQPYRLEMGTKLATARGKNLYDFWGGRIASAIDEALSDHESAALVNLASAEYFAAVSRKALRAPVIECVFQEVRGGAAKVVGLHAKRARGMMARFMVKQRLDRPQELEHFAEAGYRFVRQSSSADRLVFQRPQP